VLTDLHHNGHNKICFLRVINVTRVFLLPHSEDRVILSSFVWIGYQRVTDGQTDRQTDGRTDGIAVGTTALCIASNAAAL